MNLEDRIKEYGKQARAELINRYAQSKEKAKQGKAQWIGYDANGNSLVKQANQIKAVKVIGNISITAGSTVLIDENNTIEIKKRKSIIVPKRTKKKQELPRGYSTNSRPLFILSKTTVVPFLVVFYRNGGNTYDDGISDWYIAKDYLYPANGSIEDDYYHVASTSNTSQGTRLAFVYFFNDPGPVLLYQLMDRIDELLVSRPSDIFDNHPTGPPEYYYPLGYQIITLPNNDIIQYGDWREVVHLTSSAIWGVDAMFGSAVFDSPGSLLPISLVYNYFYTFGSGYNQLTTFPSAAWFDETVNAPLYAYLFDERD